MTRTSVLNAFASKIYSQQRFKKFGLSQENVVFSYDSYTRTRRYDVGNIGYDTPYMVYYVKYTLNITTEEQYRNLDEINEYLRRQCSYFDEFAEEEERKERAEEEKENKLKKEQEEKLKKEIKIKEVVRIEKQPQSSGSNKALTGKVSLYLWCLIFCAILCFVLGKYWVGLSFIVAWFFSCGVLGPSEI